MCGSIPDVTSLESILFGPFYWHRKPPSWLFLYENKLQCCSQERSRENGQSRKVLKKLNSHPLDGQSCKLLGEWERGGCRGSRGLGYSLTKMHFYEYFWCHCLLREPIFNSIWSLILWKNFNKWAICGSFLFIFVFSTNKHNNFLMGPPILMDPHPCQQNAGLHLAVWQLQQEVSRPMPRFKPTSPKKSEKDGGANQVPTYLGQSLQLYSPWWSSLAITTSNHWYYKHT